MKIAVPVTKNQQVDDHFGHCEFYSVFTILDNGEINGVETIPSPQGCGCKSDIASVLAANGVSVMLAGGIGAGAINVLAYHGIEVVRGCSGDAKEVIKLFVQGSIKDSGNSCNMHEIHKNGTEHHQCNHHE